MVRSAGDKGWRALARRAAALLAMLAVLAYALPLPLNAAAVAAAPFGDEIVICTAHGPVKLGQYDGDDGRPERSGEAHCLLCLGGGLAKLIPPAAAAPVLAFPRAAASPTPVFAAAPAGGLPYRPQSPRAPPLPV